ncbi:uncharacterized protein LOC143026443 isoform X2 [Oratosquilla oratoria]|uniref:uncharacterized protein LOC143026443 isoform X2 n=1 Tax=Oratosquilla oratoria TaxID=337810 RepID=UPI003F775610
MDGEEDLESVGSDVKHPHDSQEHSDLKIRHDIPVGSDLKIIHDSLNTPKKNIIEAYANIDTSFAKENKFDDDCVSHETPDSFEMLGNSPFSKDRSPARNFKSSYAKSIADSYRRVSLPSFVSTAKREFYFDKDQFLSLNQSSTSDFSKRNSNPKSLPISLNDGLRADLNAKGFLVELLDKAVLAEDMYLPTKKLPEICQTLGIYMQPRIWSGFVHQNIDGDSYITLKDFVDKLNDAQNSDNNYNSDLRSLHNYTFPGVHPQVWDTERRKWESRVVQLCESLNDRDAKIQCLEEDILRVRMECQRLIVENRSLRSNTASRQVSLENEEVSALQQQVQLLTTQLERAECSRHTYEAATKQLLEFLHTVNSTLSSSPSDSKIEESLKRTASLYNLPTQYSVCQPPSGLTMSSEELKSLQSSSSSNGSSAVQGELVEEDKLCSNITRKKKSTSKGSPRSVATESLATKATNLLESLKMHLKNEKISKAWNQQ